VNITNQQDTMPNFEIEEIGKESSTFIRSCSVKINGHTIRTPARAISITKNDNSEIKSLKSTNLIGSAKLGEVYTRVSLDFLSDVLTNDTVGQKFSSQLSNRLQELRSMKILPYLVISVVDNNNRPYNQLLSDEILDLIYNYLWGTPGNGIIVPPLLGVLPERSQYLKLISSLNTRQEESIDRKEIPIMACIPSAYSLVDPKLIEDYWNIGCRLFAFNCENKKYGAFGYTIEKLHVELSRLSKKDKESYIVHALNTKLKIGKQDSSRINNLLGTGFGFDTFGPNHIPPAGFFGDQNIQEFYLFQTQNYGFVPFTELVTQNSDQNQNILNSYAFSNIDIDTVNLNSSTKRILTNRYNLESSVNEIIKYPELIEKENLFRYLSNKEKIKNETTIMRNLADKTLQLRLNTNLDEWFV